VSAARCDLPRTVVATPDGVVGEHVVVALGATDIAVDGQRYGAVGGGLTQQTPGYHTAAARYLIIVSGGADTLTVGQAARRN
jgi:hypothetical protein